MAYAVLGLFVLVSIGLYILARAYKDELIDEFAHWGTETRSIAIADVNAARLVDPDRYPDRMKPLGAHRLQALACTSSDDPQSANYFWPPEGADLQAAFEAHLERIWVDRLPEATGPQYHGLAVVAAGLLTYGRLEMADYILGQLPPASVRGGYCNLLAIRVMKHVLPVPTTLRESPWLEGTPGAEDARRWFAENRARLAWDASAGRFRSTEAEDRGATG